MFRLAIAAVAAALLFPAAASARQLKPTMVFVHGVSLAVIQEPSTEPAWKRLESCYLIGRQDQVISPAAHRFMAKRATAHTVEIDASHPSYISHPDAVTALIVRAARSVSR